MYITNFAVSSAIMQHVYTVLLENISVCCQVRLTQRFPPDKGIKGEGDRVKIKGGSDTQGYGYGVTALLS